MEAFPPPADAGGYSRVIPSGFEGSRQGPSRDGQDIINFELWILNFELRLVEYWIPDQVWNDSGGQESTIGGQVRQKADKFRTSRTGLMIILNVGF